MDRLMGRALEYDQFDDREKAIMEKACQAVCRNCMAHANGMRGIGPATYQASGMWVHYGLSALGCDSPAGCEASGIRERFVQPHEVRDGR